jgi:hypothetical protein
MITKFFTVLGIEVRVAEQLRKIAVPHGSGKLDIGGALRGSKSGELMAQIMEVVVVQPRIADSLHPGFFDINAAKSGFAGEDKRFRQISRLIKSVQFDDDGIGKGNTARPAVFRLCKECDAFFEIDVTPLQIEDLSAPGTCSEGEEDDWI